MMLKEPKVCQENITHTITPASAGAEFWPYHLNVANRDSVSCSSPTGVTSGVAFCCCNPSALRFHTLSIQRCSSAYPSCNKWLLCYCCLSISSNQSGHSLLTYDISKALSPRQLLLTGYFLDHFLWEEMVVHKSPRRSTVYETLKPDCLAPPTMPRTMLGLNFSESSWPHA